MDLADRTGTERGRPPLQGLEKSRATPDPGVTGEDLVKGRTCEGRPEQAPFFTFVL